jgi:hypothetical protein
MPSSAVMMTLYIVIVNMTITIVIEWPFLIELRRIYAEVRTGEARQMSLQIRMISGIHIEHDISCVGLEVVL